MAKITRTTRQADPRRIREIYAGGKSLWRAYMNAEIARITLQEPIIDLGSGEPGTASYHNIIPGFYDLDVQSVDISDERRPTKIANLEEHIPYEDASFNTAILFNVIILLHDYDAALQEIFRVLKPGGVLHITAPFLVRISFDPGDYFRFTGATLERMLEKVGFDDIEVTALGDGACTAALSQVYFLVPRFLRGVLLRVAMFADAKITQRSGGVYRNASDYPLGYLVSARKPS